MPSHTETRILPYTAQQLFDLVMDIESYPAFLPWCIAARVNSKKGNVVDADVVVGYKVFRERFSSRVHFESPGSVEVEYMSGPMRQLHNTWRFEDIAPGKCRVDFYVNFSMKTRMMEKLVDQFFHRALARMITSFEMRAQTLYGA